MAAAGVEIDSTDNFLPYIIECVHVIQQLSEVLLFYLGDQEVHNC